MDTFIHELTHSLETAGAYSDFANSVMDSDLLRTALAKDGMTMAEYKQSVQSQYAQNGITLDDAGVNRKIVAKFTEQYLSDEKTVVRLANTNPHVFTKIKNWINDMLVCFKGTPEEKALVKMRQLYDNAAKGARTSTEAGATQYSIQTDADGNRYVRVDTDVAVIDSKSASKYANPGKSQANFSQKLLLAPELKNLLEISQKVSESGASKLGSAYPAYEYYSANFEIGGKMFNALVNVGIDENGNKHLYDINKIHPVSGISHLTANRPSNEMYFNDNIAQGDAAVNSQSAAPPKTIPGTDITYVVDELSGEPEIKFSKPIEEMTPEEFERVLEMAEHGGLEVE